MLKPIAHPRKQWPPHVAACLIRNFLVLSDDGMRVLKIFSYGVAGRILRFLYADESLNKVYSIETYFDFDKKRQDFKASAFWFDYNDDRLQYCQKGGLHEWQD